MNNINQWHTPVRIAIILGIPEKTIQSWMKAGLRFSKLPGKIKLIHQDSLDEFVRQHKVNEN